MLSDEGVPGAGLLWRLCGGGIHSVTSEGEASVSSLLWSLQARVDQQLSVISDVEGNILCFLPGLLVLTSGKCCISFQTKTFKVLYEMLTSRQRFESQVLEMSSPLLEPSSAMCLYKLDLICA